MQSVKWTRTDLGGEYVLFFRDNQLDPDGQNVSFKNRVDLKYRKMDNGYVSMVLKNVTTADGGGSYSCSFFNKDTKEWEHINTISLIFLGELGGLGV